MQFTIPRRGNSPLPTITVEIDARYKQLSDAMRLGAAVRVFVGRARAQGTRADLTRTNLTDADLTGANLTDANLTGADLTGAELTCANLTGANLTCADLTDADLTYANLTGADLTDANLTYADLTYADLTDADLTCAIPVIPNIDAAIYAAVTDGNGTLRMSDWHGCETTHCRAGWAIHLAGAAGYKLQAEVGPSAAGALIYARSRPGVRIPDFYASDEAALADIKACAGVE